MHNHLASFISIYDALQHNLALGWTLYRIRVAFDPMPHDKRTPALMRDALVHFCGLIREDTVREAVNLPCMWPSPQFAGSLRDRYRPYDAVILASDGTTLGPRANLIAVMPETHLHMPLDVLALHHEARYLHAGLLQAIEIDRIYNNVPAAMIDVFGTMLLPEAEASDLLIAI